MAHYATLADYRFSEDVHDIRGAQVYGPGDDKIGKVADVVFDHDKGDINGLIVNVGRDRKVLISTDHLFRSAVDENDFETDLTREQIERLPAFDVTHLHSDQSWREFAQRQQEAIRQEDRRLEQEYKREFHDDPVEHRRGSSHLVTPEASEEPPATGGPYRVTAEDLTPERLESKFPSTANTSDKLQMRPQAVVHAEDEAHSGLNAPNWTGFQNTIRENLHELRRGCAICEELIKRDVA